MIYYIALLQGGIDFQNRLIIMGYVAAICGSIITILTISKEKFIYPAWLVFSSVALLLGVTLLISVRVPNTDVPYMRAVGFGLLFGGILVVILSSIYRLAPRALPIVHVAGIVLAIVITLLLRSSFRLPPPPISSCEKLREAKISLDNKKNQEAITLVKEALAENNDKCSMDGHELLVRAYVRLSPPDCFKAFQHFAVLPAERKNEVSNEFFSHCYQAH